MLVVVVVVGVNSWLALKNFMFFKVLISISKEENVTIIVIVANG